MKSSGVERGEQHDRRGDAVRPGGKPVAERTVADLVVVLRADDEPFGGRGRVNSRTSPSIDPKAA